MALMGHGGVSLFRDEQDVRSCLDALRECAQQECVALHAFALREAALWLLVTPTEGASLGRLAQGLGRRYVAGYNQRHGRRGPLFDGRFKAMLVAPDQHGLELMCHMEGAALVDPAWLDNEVEETTSAAHHLGLRRIPWLADLSLYWQLGNTPFERELAYRRLLDDGLPSLRRQQIENTLRRCGAFGNSDFVADCARQSGRVLTPKTRGRPRGPAI